MLPQPLISIVENQSTPALHACTSNANHKSPFSRYGRVLKNQESDTKHQADEEVKYLQNNFLSRQHQKLERRNFERVAP